jgi:hypothetical protein
MRPVGSNSSPWAFLPAVFLAAGVPDTVDSRNDTNRDLKDPAPGIEGDRRAVGVSDSWPLKVALMHLAARSALLLLHHILS